MKKSIIFTDYKDIIEVIAKAAQKRQVVKIYYPKTQNAAASWREIEPYSLTIDPGPEGEHLIYGEDRISPGHILNAYTIGSKDKNCHSLILGKIKAVKSTNKKFVPRNNWKVEF